MADEILCTIADGIATITLNRPDRRNALNTATLDELHRRFNELERDAGVRVVVIRGAGTAFCSGRDLEEMSRRQRDALEPEADVIGVFQQIEASSRPSIAMVHGAAYAGGCELALHCDFRVAADVARFAMSLAGMKATIRRSAALRERIEHGDLDELARRARASADAREGVRAMLEKRKPAFRGE